MKSTVYEAKPPKSGEAVSCRLPVDIPNPSHVKARFDLQYQCERTQTVLSTGENSRSIWVMQANVQANVISHCD